MSELNRKTTLWVTLLTLLALISVVSSCATATPSGSDSAAADTAAAPSAAPSEAAGEGSSTAPSESSAAPMQVAAADTKAAEDLSKVAEIAAAPKIVGSCKKEEFSKWEANSRAAIKAGWEATKEKKYGIGFKNADEYKQWSEMHNLIFKSISDSCDELSQCGKKNGKNKNKACAGKAANYSDWQKLAKEFTDRVENVKVTQLDDMCQYPLTLSDSRNCFEKQAKNIADHCNSEACQDASQCWQNLAFMGDAIIQAETACKFSHIKLEKCRGYVEQKMRRKNQIESCEFLQKKLEMKFLPVL